MDNWGEGVVPACREERPIRFIYFFLYSINNFFAYSVLKNHLY